MSRVLTALLALALPLAGAAPALAFDFGSSSTTGKGVSTIPFKIGTPRDQPVAAELGIRFSTGLSDALGPAKLNPQWKDQGSWLADADFVFLGNFKLADMQLGPMGRFRPIISPFLGARYLAAPTWEAPDPVELAKSGITGISNAGTALSFSNYTGVEYGCKAAVDLPLAFQAEASLGLTTLLSGGWDTRRASAASLAAENLDFLKVTGSGKTDPGASTLPDAGVRLTWRPLPAFQLYVGYEVLALPTKLRDQTARLPSGLTWINNLQVGANILSFSI
jgi:hypothetical protein